LSQRIKHRIQNFRRPHLHPPLRGEENEGHPDVINYRAVINKDEDIRRV
jgi:hypothetical protein